MNERDLTIQYYIHIWVRIRLYWDSLGVFVYCNSKPDPCILRSLSFSTTFSQKIWTWKNWGKHIDFCSENICIALLDKILQYYDMLIFVFYNMLTVSPLKILSQVSKLFRCHCILHEAIFPNIAGAWNLILIIGKIGTMFCTEKKKMRQQATFKQNANPRQCFPCILQVLVWNTSHQTQIM